MHRFLQAAGKIHTSTKEILFFGAIFTIYFMSSVGIMNTMDGAQYYTTEALIQTRNIDLAPMTKYEHFNFTNDLAYEGNRILPLRGVHQSILAMPLHFISKIIAPIVSTHDFPKFISLAKDFKYELNITSLYAIYSVLGVYFIYKTLQEFGVPIRLNVMLVIVLAFGTPVWKYSAAYIRQGIVFMLFSLTLYVVGLYIKRRVPNDVVFWLWAFLIPFSFGVDPLSFLTIFLSLALSIAVWCMYSRSYVISLMSQIRFDYRIVIIFFLSMSFVILMNLTFFGTFMSTQYEKYPPFAGIPKEELLSVVFGTPIFPTIFHVLFGTSALPLEIFHNTIKYSKLAEAISVSYSIKYEYYGLFMVAPIFLLAISSIVAFYKKSTKIEKYLYLVCCIMIVLFLVPTTKWHAFHAPNSYDIKYFYPIYAPMTVILALSLKFWPKLNNSFFKICITVLFLITIFSGFVGVLNAYAPFMSGERRVWVNTINDVLDLPQVGLQNILNAVVPNRSNFFIPITIMCFFVAIDMMRIKYWRRLRDMMANHRI